VSFRSDVSVPEPESAQYWFSMYLKDNKISAADAENLAFVETEYTQFVLNENQYKWNESTLQIEEDPSYVAPTPEPTEPTA
jgi:hypothetical protein